MSEQEFVNSTEPLTDAQRDHLMRRIYCSLAGDPLNPSSHGIIRRVEEHHIDLNGSDQNKQQGLKEKVGILWDWRVKILAVCAATAFGISLLSWVLPMLFHR